MLIADGSAATLVLNADDPSIAQLGEAARGEIVSFGIEDSDVAVSGAEHASDARFCRCGAPFRYDAVYVGHAGVWRCDGCGRSRPTPDVLARSIEVGADGTRFVLDVRGEAIDWELPLVGLYAVYNAVAAAAVASAAGIEASAIAEGVAGAGPAFGRQETFSVDGRELRMWLAKNPAGLNAVLHALQALDPPEDGSGIHLLAFLNDGIQDGRDVSWIYDADLELLRGRLASLVVSGARAEDLALRCSLAGLRIDAVEPHRSSALDVALRRVPEGGRLELVATYTAMLELRELIAAGAGVAPYWERPGEAAS